MKRLARILLNALTALSLILFVATVALWVRSQWLCETICFRKPIDPPVGEVKQRETTLTTFRDAISFRQTIYTYWVNRYDVTNAPAEEAWIRSLLAGEPGFTYQKSSARWRPMERLGVLERPTPPWGPSDPRSFSFWRFYWYTDPPCRLYPYTPGRMVGTQPLDAWPYITVRAVPWWFLVSIFSVGPIRFLVIVRRWRTRRRQGLCRRCGYDLRATPDRCPECGSVPAGR